MIRKDMGRLPNKTRMENPDVVFAETQSFDYNIRGWWNSSFAYNKLDKKYIQTDGTILGARANFEHTLSYNFNGNIKEAIWGNATGQDYTYDGLNRLTAAIGKTNTKFSEVLDYDENGNIRTLNRKDITGTEVDKLTYTYEANSNKLISVADAGTAASYPNVGGNFTYDNNGNQTNYLPRGISTITYNILNLVNTVIIDGKGTQSYTYAADGTKLGFKQGYDVKVKSYIGAVEYDGDGKISRIGTEEGYVLKRTGWNENSKDSKFVYYYSVKDHLGNVRLVLDDESNAKLWQRNDYQAFGMHINQPVDGVPTPELVGINDRYYNGKEFDDQTTWLDYGARQYDYSLNKWMSVDPAHEDGGQESFTPYGYVFDNPMKYTDPDGRCPNCVTGAIGAGLGALIGGGIEAGIQLYKHGEISDWKAVGGAALQGGITGGAAGFTGGASLLVTAGVAGGANVVGGAANRAIQGQGTTLANVATDATVGVVLGAGGKLVGNAVSSGTNNLSNSAKGNLGEAITEVKYAAQGYKSSGKAIVETGGKTATGKNAVAKYDHAFTNVFTGKQITVESKFNGSTLTPNQAAAQSSVATPGGLIVDRTTSQGLGNSAKAATVGTGAGIDAQRNKKP